MERQHPVSVKPCSNLQMDKLNFLYVIFPIFVGIIISQYRKEFLRLTKVKIFPGETKTMYREIDFESFTRVHKNSSATQCQTLYKLFMFLTISPESHTLGIPCLAWVVSGIEHNFQS